jgi:hypothetical protein
VTPTQPPVTEPDTQQTESDSAETQPTETAPINIDQVPTSSTDEPLVTPAVQDTSAASPAITIVDPQSDAEIQEGATIMVTGTANGGDQIQVVLLQSGGSVLDEADAPIENGLWSVSLTMPERFTGLFQIQAALIDTFDVALLNAEVAVMAVPDPSSATAMVLYDPVAGSTVFSGKTVRMSGEAKFSGETAPVTLSILTEACSVIVAAIGFNMVGSGIWEGFLNVPPNVSGPICVTATLGNPNSAESYTAFAPVTAVQPAP